ncbi:MAG: hypothetical protein ACI9T7_002415 [Oleiphilaceae bacterium]|jgi:hypothetical protein
MLKKGLLMALLMSQCTASYALDLYAGIDANYIFSEVEEGDASAEFNPVALSGRFGAYIEKGVGIELYGMTGTKDEDLDIDLSINYMVGLAARFETPESEGGKIYFLLGYGITELDMDRSGSGEPGTATFHDFSYGGGVEFRLGSSENLFINLQGVRYYAQDDITIDGASLGLRLQF